MINSHIQIQTEITPNPQALKFEFNHKISDYSLTFDDKLNASNSPLAQKILGFPWVKQIFIGTNFITITKENWVEWDSLKQPLIELILEHIKSKIPIILPSNNSLKNSDKNSDSHLNLETSSKENSVIKKIKNIIDTKIQPAVQMDGGLIEFSNYKEGIVYIKMQGACSGCPSAISTLKEGIESLLKENIPEIREVISL